MFTRRTLPRKNRGTNLGLITDERTPRSRPILCTPCGLRTSMDAAVGDQSAGVPIQQRPGDCHYLISSDLVRVNVDRLRRLIALTNRSFYPRDKSATRRKSNATVKTARRDKRRT
ncbi:PREDICTED: uncharacterized protein LOC105455715 [Wasmannia auropunctata]|uniref:uncharacterized protein LOC105455715 n=1 Tax=Wasmannia auropunctata TaxID=64793 RepID=UPI0005ED4E64|nr:PREDICTED: uncharacterized protein LOC105455715 [Wasmannia auropunctata]